MTVLIQTTYRRPGLRVIRRTRLHQPPPFWQRLLLLLWTGGQAEQVHARQLRLAALAAEQEPQLSLSRQVSLGRHLPLGRRL